ncbi:UvrD-helicase domain-containing protein [Flavobacterium okayamense]|uniref:DNA 3'-5' helicase n=1 Tax=Flavobacterium okayamense TaxID=2830782 RepID=A0ABM7S265_9FLAO|nr:UvrD-helicase domain-containing protein [Flavobacterium okayamense]BCY27683.1 ATP-dependent helicase [Flavobacterium okayamense]
MSNTSSFTIYNASAGSGKTYTLTKEYLKILIKSRNNDAYKKILAITFTNKAVEEMKNRVVNSLFEFSKDNTSEKSMSLLKDLSIETGFSINTIKEKSKKIIKDIIHNYSAFGISTIDKFTHKIIRTFAQDLELPSNFEIALDTDVLLQEAVDSVIAQVGEDEELTQFILEFTKNKTDDDKNWDISYELFEVSKLITNENNVQEIKAFEDKNFDDFVEIKEKLEQNIKRIESSCVEIASMCLQNINKNVNPKSFYRSYVTNFIQKISEGDLAINTTVIKYLDGEKERYSKSVSQNEKDWIDENANKILHEILIINSKVGKTAFYKAFLQNINSLSLLNTVNKEFRRIQEEQNVLSISDFNKIIFNKIQGEPTPFIYERLGEKYRHYFIDEFQDTSEMQWKNLIPLIDNALASEENGIKGTLMLVGDPKQSIYRWRGGKAEQFIKLSKDENPFSNKDKKVENLDTNYRSYSEVIEFNNKFFSFLSQKFENENYSELYKNTSFQNTNQKEGGYVNISFIESNQEEYEDFDENEIGYSYKNIQYLEKTIETIQKVVEQGFSYGDIVLLTRRKDQGVLLANYLTENDIPILSSETLLIQNATEVKLIIALLRYLNNSKDEESKAFILYFVGRYCQNKLPIHDFILKNKNLSELEIEDELKGLGIMISFKNCRTKSLYDAVEILVNAFVKEKANTSYVQYFMDLVLEKDSKSQLGITEFLDYWDKIGFQKSIPSPEGSNAIRIMTIHKSKGLEFPVVIIPFAEENFSRNKGNKLWVDFEESDEINFPKAFVNSKNDVKTYSESAKIVFEQKTQEELLDTINVLYVALTRAEEQLYVISNKLQTKKGDIVTNNLSFYFIDFLDSQGKFNGDLEFEFGLAKRISEFKPKINSSKNIELVQNKFPFENIKIAQKEALLWGTEQQEAINFGNVFHEILANIKTKKDINLAIDKAIETGLISLNDIDFIQSKIHEILNHNSLKLFFSDEAKVMNEQTIIDSEQGNIKPDKIVFYENSAMILDYKTGDKKKSHIYQINNYANVLERMNFNVIKKALVYTGDKVEVVIL